MFKQVFKFKWNVAVLLHTDTQISSNAPTPSKFKVQLHQYTVTPLHAGCPMKR